MKKLIFHALNVTGFLLLVGLTLLLYYGHKTVCPNVAVFVKCNDFFN
jgi:hypothetical protein